MTIARFSPNPEFVKSFASLNPPENELFTIFDIGARDGVEGYWKHIRNVSRIISFDADEEECRRLNQNKMANEEYYPYAIYGRNSREKFYVTSNPAGSGFHKVNPEYISRFPNREATKVVKELELDTVTLDWFSEQNKMQHIDFLKLDVEGAELDVLKGFENGITQKKVLGLKTEFWWDPVIKGQPSFAELDSYIRSKGFYLFDIRSHTYPRKTMPAGFLQVVQNNEEMTVNCDRSSGQIITGDALYFRDPVEDIIGGKSGLEWDFWSIVRMISLFEIFMYNDCAIELVFKFKDLLVGKLDIEKTLDMLTPQVSENRKIPYREYLKISNNVCEQINNRVGAKFYAPTEDLFEID